MHVERTGFVANQDFFVEQLLHGAAGRHVTDTGLFREFEDASQRFVSHWGSAMFALVPLFAMWVRLAWLNRRLRYTEHLVFALHLHSFWFAALVLVQILPGALAVVPILWMPVYALLATRRVYGGRWRVLIARNLAVALAYGISMLLALGVVTLWTLVG